MGKKVKHSDTLLNCKIYLPPKNKTAIRNEDIFPEWNLESIRNKPNIGLCFSGGGTRSAAATIGQLRALHSALGILEHFRYISCVSGSAWALTALYYGDINDEKFLGSIVLPEQITYEDIMNEETEDTESFIHAICSTNVFQRFMKTAVASNEDDRAYAKAVGDMYLEPFHCGSMEKFFTWDEASVEDILLRNSHLSKDDFYFVKRKNFPYLITGTMLYSNSQLNPFHRKFLFEMTPLYIGNHTQLSHGETEREITEKRGGGYVEPLGFNTIIADSDQDSTSKKLFLKSDLTCQNVKLRVIKPFTLSDMIGTTSAAPAFELFRLGANWHGNGFPWYNYWSPPLSRMRGVETEWLEFGDGGIIDNLGILSMLRRRVTSIVVFLNTNRKLLIPEHESQKTHFMSQISQDICIYFGKDKYLKCRQQNTIANVEQKLDARITAQKKENLYPIHLTSYITETDFIKNHVFNDEGNKYETLIKGLIEKRKNGQIPAFRDTYTVLDNVHHGIIGGWKVDILWIYNERIGEWEERIPKNERELFRFNDKRSPFTRFPSYHTWRENKNNLIGLKTGQARLLSHLSSYATLGVANDIKDMLRNEIEKCEKRKRLPPIPMIVKKRIQSMHAPSLSSEYLDGTSYTGAKKKEIRLKKLAEILLQRFREHISDQSQPLESNTVIAIEHLNCKILRFRYTNFVPRSYLSSIIVEVKYKDENPKLYKFKVSPSLRTASLCMNIFTQLNSYWSEHDVPAIIGTYEIFSFSIGDVICGFIEYIENGQALSGLSCSASPLPCSVESVTGLVTASFLLGLHSQTTNSLLVKDRKLYILHFNAFGLHKSRIELFKDMLHVPDFIRLSEKKVLEKWFMYGCRVAYNVLPPLDTFISHVEEKLLFQYGSSYQAAFEKGALENIDENVNEKLLEVTRYKDNVIKFITHRYENYRGKDLIQILKSSAVVKLSQIMKVLKLKNEDLENVAVRSPYAYVVTWNIFKVGIHSFQKVTDTTQGWNISAACHHKESFSVFIASRKSGALYRFDLRNRSTKRLLARAWKWSESKCIVYDSLGNFLYIVRCGKKYKDICKVNITEGTFVKIETDADTFANVHKCAALQNWKCIYIVQNDKSLHCFEIEKNESRCVLPENSFHGYFDHFIACGNVFYAFGMNGIAKFDPQTAQLVQVSHKTWEAVSIGIFGAENLQTFLIVSKLNGELILWDARSDEEKVISHWNENWADTSYVF